MEYINTEYVNLIAVQLQNSLPPVVTREELLNHYLHNMKIKRNIDLAVTTKELCIAANLANIKVKGHSKLEINVPFEEQLKYMNEKVQPMLCKQDLKQMLEANKEDIVKAYEAGATAAELAKVWHCCTGTMNTYLNKFGAKMRKTGQRGFIIRETGTNHKKRRKKY